MATVVTPHWVNQSASTCRSVVKALNSRTETTSRPSGTATRWRSEPMSMPAAFTLMCRKWRGRAVTTNSLAWADCFFTWCEMIFFSLSGITENGSSRLWAQGCEIVASSLSGSHSLSRVRTSPVVKALTPETKLLHGQYAPMINRPSRPTTCCIIALLASRDTGKSFTMANVRRRDGPQNSYVSVQNSPIYFDRGATLRDFVLLSENNRRQVVVS